MRSTSIEHSDLCKLSSIEIEHIRDALAGHAAKLSELGCNTESVHKLRALFIHGREIVVKRSPAFELAYRLNIKKR